MINQVVKLPGARRHGEGGGRRGVAVDVGDNGEVGTPLMRVETDKMTTDVLSPVAGTSLSPSSASRTRSPSAHRSPVFRVERRRFLAPRQSLSRTAPASGRA